MTDGEVAHSAELRRLAFGIAYRMLGTVSDAEDVVQESLLRLHLAARRGERIDSPRAYLATVVSRLALDHLRSAAVRRETYIGDWLPEPLLTPPDDDPAAIAETSDALSLAFLLLLERLSPEQRAAFLLHDLFDEPYPRIADVVGTTEQNARQLVSRARRHLQQQRPRFEAGTAQHQRLADRFFDAARDGRIAELEELLAHDVVLRSDGGGGVPNIPHSVTGRVRVARLLAAGLGPTGRISGGFTYRREQINGQPGVVASDQEGRVGGVLVLSVVDGQVTGVDSIVNPDKLRHLGPTADLQAARPDTPRAPRPERQEPWRMR